MAHDLAPCVAAVRNAITAPVTQNQFDAMVMLTFNIGVSAFTTSSVCKLINNPDAASPYPNLEAAWKAWDRSQGKVWLGWIIAASANGTFTRTVSMRVGDMKRTSSQLLRRTLVAAAVSLFASTACFGIDNPDAPDRLKQFQQNASVYEARINAQAGTTQDMVGAYASYQRFLEDQLTEVYDALAKRLDPKPGVMLAKSQRRWLAYRAAENGFIERNWTQDRFGTSAPLSRGAYRASIVKDRVTELIQYLKNYR